jgi:hypothetical protein
MSATPTQTSAPPSQRPRKTKNLEIKTYLNGTLVSDIVIDNVAIAHSYCSLSVPCLDRVRRLLCAKE